MVFEDKFEYVHSNEKKILEKFVASSSKHRDRGNGGAGRGRLNPFPPPPARFEMVEETSKEAKLADQVGSLFITMDMVYSFPAKYLSLEQLCIFTLSILLRHISRSPYSMLTLKASGYQPSPPPSPLHHSKPCFAVNERAALKGLSKSNVSAKFSLIHAISRWQNEDTKSQN